MKNDMRHVSYYVLIIKNFNTFIWNPLLTPNVSAVTKKAKEYPLIMLSFYEIRCDCLDLCSESYITFWCVIYTTCIFLKVSFTIVSRKWVKNNPVLLRILSPNRGLQGGWAVLRFYTYDGHHARYLCVLEIWSVPAHIATKIQDSTPHTAT